jgi:hypothetical protein
VSDVEPIENPEDQRKAYRDQRIGGPNSNPLIRFSRTIIDAPAGSSPCHRIGVHFQSTNWPFFTIRFTPGLAISRSAEGCFLADGTRDRGRGEGIAELLAIGGQRFRRVLDARARWRP